MGKSHLLPSQRTARRELQAQALTAASSFSSSANTSRKQEVGQPGAEEMVRGEVSRASAEEPAEVTWYY